jgi:5-methylcytosine-specific restriction endonuclease McrA
MSIDKICLRCQISKLFKDFSPDKRRKDGCQSYCKKCSAVISKISRLKHKEYYQDYNKKYYQNNKKHLNARGKKYHKLYWEKNRLNPKFIEKMHEYSEKYCQRPEVKNHKQEYSKKWREKNQIYIRKKAKELRQTLSYKEKHSVYEHNRRSKIKNLPGILFLNEWQKIKMLYDNICPACNKQRFLEIDHIFPISKAKEFPDFTTNSIENIQPLCHECNDKKYNRVIARYLPEKYYTDKIKLDFWNN